LRFSSLQLSQARLTSVSEADVQLFQSWAEQLAVAEGDPLDWMYENMWAEDIDHRAIEGAPDDHGPIIGRAAMRAYLAEWFEMFPDLKIAFEDITDVGPGRVLVVTHVAGTAKTSGVPTEIRVPILWTVCDGKIVRGREYLTMDEARQVAGLNE
jgi:ketosteroid isomerase-like protein